MSLPFQNRTGLKVLIAGASGLIGGRLIRHFLDTPGIQVRAASRIPRAWPSDVEGCITDLNRPATLLEACRGIDAVINLASMAERDAAADPHGALRVTAGGALGLSSAASTEGVRRFVQVSTYKVYGNNLFAAVVTETTPTAPQSHYAITHRAAEDYAATQHSSSVVLRLANGFGMPVDSAAASSWHIIVNEMCKEAVLNNRIVIKSSGLGWRNFVPMHDVVRALTFAAADLPDGTYNMGFERSMTLREAAELVRGVCAETLGTVPEVVTEARSSTGCHEPLEFDVGKLAATGFVSTASLDDEIRGTLLGAHRLFRGGRA